jgi:beta-lactamase class A
MQVLKREIEAIVAGVEGQGSVVVLMPQGGLDIAGDQRFPAASLIKLPILMELYRQYQEGGRDLETILPILPEQKVGGMGVIRHLTGRIQLSLRNLATLMIISSDNTATNLLIELLGMEKVNALCQSFGAKNTVLNRSMMDLPARERGVDNFTSARDMVAFLRQIAQGNFYKESLRGEMLRILRGQQHNSELPGKITAALYGSPLMAHKTGGLPGVEHDAGIFEMGDTYIYVAGLFAELRCGWEGRRALAEIGRAVYSFASGL